MTTDLISDGAFRLLLSVVTAGAAGYWGLHDAIMLFRMRGRRGDRELGDERFGYAMGVVIGAIGVLGTLRYNGVL